MNRTQLTLAGIFVLQLVLILLVRSPFTSASARTEPRLLLPQLEATSPGRVVIEGKDDERITLVRHGEDWSIEELDDFPADGEKVEQLLEDLERIEVRRPVVTSSRYHEAFKVTDEDRAARVKVYDGDEVRADLIVGSSANYRTTNVRLGDEDEVYEIQGLAPYDVRPAQSTWIEKKLVDLPSAEIDRLSLTNSAGQFELEKRDGDWAVVSPEDKQDEKLDQAKIDALVRAATSLQLSDAVGPVDDAAQGFASPAATLVLRGGPEGAADEASGALDLTLIVGDKPSDEENKRYVTRSGFGYTGTIWESSVSKLLEDSLDSLQAAPGEDEG